MRSRQRTTNRLTPEQEEELIAQSQAQLDRLSQQAEQVAAGLKKTQVVLKNINETYEEIKKELRKVKKVRESLEEVSKKLK